MMKIIIALLLSISLSSCTALGVAKMLSGKSKGGGTNVAANTQVGKQNNQSLVDQSQDQEINAEVVQIETSAIKPSGDVGKISVMNQDIPMWVILLLVLGWVLPSPIEIWRGFLKTITLGRYKG
tara:strand:+ start:1015 stop:1386 length:372 start_codon:yes stop_codon:yes gene_type:complete